MEKRAWEIFYKSSVHVGSNQLLLDEACAIDFQGWFIRQAHSLAAVYQNHRYALCSVYSETQLFVKILVSNQ